MPVPWWFWAAGTGLPAACGHWAGRVGAAAKDSLLEGSAHGQPNHLIFTIPNKFQPPSLTCGLVEHGPTIAALLFNNDIVFQLQFLFFLYISRRLWKQYSPTHPHRCCWRLVGRLSLTQGETILIWPSSPRYRSVIHKLVYSLQKSAHMMQRYSKPQRFRAFIKTDDEKMTSFSRKFVEGQRQNMDILRVLVSASEIEKGKKN